MPDSNGRIEIRYPLSDTMPSDLSALLTGVSLGKQLVNLATIHTTRKRSRITDPTSHQLVAEIADDHVCATVDEGTGEPIRWREVEVELGPAADEVPRKLAKRLASAGAKPSRYPSKLARVAAVSSTEDRPAHAGKAEEALARHMHAQIEQIFQGDVVSLVLVPHAAHATRPRSCHRLGPLDLPFKSKRYRHGSVAVPMVSRGGFIAVGWSQQRAQP